MDVKLRCQRLDRHLPECDQNDQDMDASSGVRQAGLEYGVPATAQDLSMESVGLVRGPEMAPKTWRLSSAQ
eukprot:7073330-Pyramimonas_sp.AAC.1